MWLNTDGTLETMYTVDWIDAILGNETTINIFDRVVKFKIPKIGMPAVWLNKLLNS